MSHVSRAGSVSTAIRTAGGLLAAILLPAAASATQVPLPLSYQTTYNGSATVTTPSFPSGTLTVVPNAPTAYFYGDTFSGATPIIPATITAGHPAGYGFYDDFVFTVGPAQVDSISSTISLGSLQVAGFSERLFNLSGNTLPTFGTPAGGAIDAWSTPLSGPISGTVNVLPVTTLAAGTYVLELRGTVASAGSYSGTLDVTPVPLPAALPLLLGGLGLFGAARRRRAA